jgi:hypothetical protein
MPGYHRDVTFAGFPLTNWSRLHAVAEHSPAWRSPSQHPVRQRKLADYEGHQEAEREHNEYRDDEFEQGV